MSRIILQTCVINSTTQVFTKSDQQHVIKRVAQDIQSSLYINWTNQISQNAFFIFDNITYLSKLIQNIKIKAR